ncbi:MAG: Na+/H+ antiporter subunit E [Gammaproteobacteria bacterium]|nr:Na+/H+ antiporter subunit E [Gammaproteobacteria bacterium]
MAATLRSIATLVVLWLFLSGLYKLQLLLLGAISVALVVWLANRMKVMQHRGQPIYFRFLHILGYWGWLIKQIFLSNVEVTRLVLSRDLPIKPTLRRVSATPNTEMGRVVYANSITLTPGTTAINFTPDDDILVHALHEDSLHELESGEMADHIKAVEPKITLSTEGK